MKVWVSAARPRTLPAAVAPVLVGTAAAERFSAWRFAGVLAVALALQVGVNYANDYFDGTRGVDTPQRVGPPRAVAAGVVSPAAMRRAMLVAFGIACVAGLALAATVNWALLAVGGAAVVAALGYSGGPRPYASAGLGEMFVFVFFGLVATVGSAFVQQESVPAASVPASAAVGALATAILVVNNLRDVHTDAAAGKRTLAVRLGAARTRNLFTGLVAAALTLVPVTAVVAGSPWPLLGLAAAPAAAWPVTAVRRAAEGRALIPALGGTARLELLLGILLALGLAADRAWA